MKVALLLPGFLRTYKENFLSLKENLLDIYDTDVYISTWNINEYGYEESFINDLEHLYGKHLKKLSIINYELYNTKSNRMLIYDEHKKPIVSYSKETVQTTTIKLVHGHYWVERLRDQWFLIKNLYDEIIMPEEYDIILKLRFDIKLNQPLLFRPEFTIPANPHHNYTDHLAFGNPNVMKKYCHLYDNIMSLYENYNIDISYAEGLLKYYMEEYGEKIITNYVSPEIYKLNK